MLHISYFVLSDKTYCDTKDASDILVWYIRIRQAIKWCKKCTDEYNFDTASSLSENISTQIKFKKRASYNLEPLLSRDKNIFLSDNFLLEFLYYGHPVFPFWYVNLTKSIQKMFL